jgi:heme A synthase
MNLWLRIVALACAVAPMVVLFPLGFAGTLFALGTFLEAAFGHHYAPDRLSLVQAGIQVLTLIAAGYTGLYCIIVALLANDLWLKARPSLPAALLVGTALAVIVTLQIAIGSSSFADRNLILVVAPILPASCIAAFVILSVGAKRRSRGAGA